MAVQEFTTEELEIEEWRDIPGYEGFYQASSLGRIRSSRTLGCTKIGKVLRPGTNRGGYLLVALCRGSRASLKGLLVHRLVTMAFIGPIPSGKEVNHIDANTSNNRADNLEYVTRLENMRHAAKLGLMNPRRGPNPKHQGEKCPAAKLTNKDVVAIRKALLRGVKGRTLAAQYGVTAMNITKIKLGQCWNYLAEEREAVREQIGKSWKRKRMA